MQTGLNLRIPDFSTPISKPPPPNTRPSSPKPPERKLHKPLPHTAAYKRIISKTSLKKVSIPSFLQSFPETRQTKHNHNSSSDITTNISSQQSQDLSKNKVQIKSIKEILSFIFSEKHSKDENLLKVGKILLTKTELQSLHPDATIDRRVLEACLRCLKHINRKLFKLNEDHDRVLVVDTHFSQTIFSSAQKEVVNLRNPLKYNKVLFPLYIGYWTLVVLDNRAIKLIVYNVRDEATAGQIFEAVREFIKRELEFHDKKCFDASSWRDLRIENVDLHPISEAVSAALTLRIAYKLAVKPEASLDLNTLPNFRFKLLILLFNHGTVMCN